MFKFENLNHIDKKRNRKRGSYHLFLKYIEEHNINKEYAFEKNKDLYIPLIDDFLNQMKSAFSQKEELANKSMNAFIDARQYTWDHTIRGILKSISE